MKNAAIVPEIVDPYATLEKILKVIGRSWLSEEWRLEDIRLLAQEALEMRDRQGHGKCTRTALSSPSAPIGLKESIRAHVTAKRNQRTAS
jgi:hypothetical protein